jgi:mycothiol synthase
VIGPSIPVAEGPLSPGQADLVLELAAAAKREDGVAPLSEHILLQLRRGSAAGSRDLMLFAEDRVAGFAHLDAPDADADADTDTAAGDMSGELVVHPAYRRRGYGKTLISALTAGANGHGMRLWAHGDLAGAAALARSTGFTRIRALWQMRMPLTGPSIASPALPPGITLRTFRPGQDEMAWLRVNSRAFADHPEQGSWTLEDLELREAEPWFDPAGFFLAERAGELAGFHWTKVHEPETGGSPLGEVYVVGVDPAQQGGGLGRTLTLAGLAHLQGVGLAQVMLYVDESNTTAVRMYTTLGFGRWSTDVMYRRPCGRLRSAVVKRPDAEHGIKLRRGERPIAGRHGAEYLGVELDLVQGHIVVNTKIDLHGNRAHLR